MKLSKLNISIPIALIFMLAGCSIVEFDNYDEPTSELSGNITYNGHPVGVRTPSVNPQGNTTTGVQLELWQSGYELSERIPVFIKHDGSFTAMLFDGDYKMVRFSGAPWPVNTDTIHVQVSGKTVIEVPVNPFFVVNNETIQKEGDNIVARFNVEQVVQGAELDYVRLYVGKTLLTDQNRFIDFETDLNPDLNGVVTLSVAVPASLATENYLFTRIGVKAAGVDELLYTQTQKIEL